MNTTSAGGGYNRQITPLTPPSTLGSGTSGSSGSQGLESATLKIVPNIDNNSILIYASPTEYTLVETALKQLDVLSLEVLIEASVAEVTLTDDLKFGIQWSKLTKQGPVTFSDASNGAISSSFPGLSLLYNAHENITAVLNSLQSLTNVRVLSSPKILVLNNHEAHLQVGDQVPIITQSAVSTVAGTAPVVNSVQMQNTGVLLSVTPRANKSGRIILEVSQEVSNATATTSSTISSPTIQERKIDSTVSVASGETIALGGMIQEQTSKSGDGVPFLRSIPLIGPIFGSVDRSKQRTELLVLITPRIIPLDDTTEFQELRTQFQSLKKWRPDISKPMPEPQATSP